MIVYVFINRYFYMITYKNINIKDMKKLLNIILSIKKYFMYM